MWLESQPLKFDLRICAFGQRRWGMRVGDRFQGRVGVEKWYKRIVSKTEADLILKFERWERDMRMRNGNDRKSCSRFDTLTILTIRKREFHRPPGCISFNNGLPLFLCVCVSFQIDQYWKIWLSILNLEQKWQLSIKKVLGRECFREIITVSPQFMRHKAHPPLWIFCKNCCSYQPIQTNLSTTCLFDHFELWKMRFWPSEQINWKRSIHRNTVFEVLDV